MNLLNRLWSSLTPDACAIAPPPQHNETCGEDEPPCTGCGWFDSSHELQRGLVVSEHDGIAVTAAALPLAVWLNSQLDDWRPEADAELH